MASKKEMGQVFTPQPLVEYMLDMVGYSSSDILWQHIIDNSCGDGAFLCVIVERYCKEYFQKYEDPTSLAEQLGTYIHGIELDIVAYQQCKIRLNEIATKWGLPPVVWDIVHGDALSVPKYDSSMDFVVGNPPYIRVHNLKEHYEKVKSFSFGQDGMMDLYLIFFELGFRQLSPTGKLCYITPSSWLHSVAGRKLREYIHTYRTLRALVDFGHYQVFDNVTTYTIISFFDKRERYSRFIYNRYSEKEKQPLSITELSFDEAFIGQEIYLGVSEELRQMRAIRQGVIKHYARVKNGFATLNDNFFIRDKMPFEKYVIPIVKASIGKWREAFYPYTEKGNPLSLSDLEKVEAIKTYLEKEKFHAEKKEGNRSVPYFLYGRTQAIKDVYKPKFAINTCVKDIASIKLCKVPIGAGVYSGLYILTEVAEETLQKVLLDESFIAYVTLLRKYKSGGYYAFNSKDLELYLNYFLSSQNDEDAIVR